MRHIFLTFDSSKAAIDLYIYLTVDPRNILKYPRTTRFTKAKRQKITKKNKKLIIPNIFNRRIA